MLVQTSEVETKTTTPISNITVSGFAPIRCVKKDENGDYPSDYAFVVEVKWMDGRANVVKRTYQDFHAMHYALIAEFAETAAANENPRKITSCLPVHKPREANTIQLAEKRELQLNKYCKELIKLPPKISECATVLTFFETRKDDPTPYKDENVTEPRNFIKDYVICYLGDSDADSRDSSSSSSSDDIA